MIIADNRDGVYKIEFSYPPSNPRMLKLMLRIAEWAHYMGKQGKQLKDFKFKQIEGKTYFVCRL